MGTWQEVVPFEDLTSNLVTAKPDVKLDTRVSMACFYIWKTLPQTRVTQPWSEDVLSPNEATSTQPAWLWTHTGLLASSPAYLNGWLGEICLRIHEPPSCARRHIWNLFCIKHEETAKWAWGVYLGCVPKLYTWAVYPGPGLYTRGCIPRLCTSVYPLPIGV